MIVGKVRYCPALFVLSSMEVVYKALRYILRERGVFQRVASLESSNDDFIFLYGNSDGDNFSLFLPWHYLPSLNKFSCSRGGGFLFVRRLN